MNAEMIMGLVIVSLVAVIMIIIGLVEAFNKYEPVGFYNVIDPPKREEISDIVQWNRNHGLIWIFYGICIELGFWLGFVMPNQMLGIVSMIGGIMIPLPFMVLIHRILEKKYKVK